MLCLKLGRFASCLKLTLAIALFGEKPGSLVQQGDEIVPV